MTVDDGYGAGGRGTRVVLWASLGAVLVAVLAVVGLHAWGAARLERLEGEMRAAAGPEPPTPATIPEEENAAARILSGAELMSIDRNQVFERLRRRPVARWTADDVEAAREILLANAAALARMRGAAELPRASFAGTLGDWETGPTPELLPLVIAAGDLLRLHAGFALARGEPELAAGSVRALARLAAALYEVPSTSAVLEGAEAEREALRALQTMVAVGTPPELLESVVQALPENDPRQAYRRGLARLLEQVRSGEADPARAGSTGGLGTYALRDLRLARVLDATVAAAAAPDERPLSEVLDELGATADDGSEIRGPSDALTLTRTVLAGRRLAPLAVALRRQGAESGGYPRTAPEAPRDPVEGGPFAYQLRSDGSARLAYPAAWQVVEAGPGSPDLLEWILPPSG